MTRNTVIGSALWCAVALNVLGVCVFLPAAMGRDSVLLPIPGPPFFTAQVALVIGLFGGCMPGSPDNPASIARCLW